MSKQEKTRSRKGSNASTKKSHKKGTNSICAIIPSFHDGKHVLKLVKQLQSKKVDQIIIIESGDSKYFSKLSKNKSHTKIKLLTGGRGRGAQMNIAAAHASSDVLWFLHADSNIEGIDVSKLRKLPKIAWGNFKIRFSTSHFYFRYIEFQSHIRAKYFHTVFGDQGIFITKSLWKKSKGYNPPYEDINISRVLRTYTKNIALPDRIVSSPRRFFKHGPFFTHVVMGAIVIAYALNKVKFATKLYQYIK